MNLRWPSTPGNDYRPWYQCLWRLPWTVLFYVGVSISWWGLLMMDGLEEAGDWWDETV